MVTKAESLVKQRRKFASEILHSVLTEENTDRAKDLLVAGIAPKLPFWARWLPIGYVLDALLPEVLLSVIDDLLGL